MFLAEIVCLMCGRKAGTALAEHWPPTRPILFQPLAARAASLVRAWWRIRCATCGGNTAADAVTIRTVRLELLVDWRTQRPRRGRPPKCRRWREDGTWQHLHDAVRADVRRAAGRDPQPSAAILDSQSVKTVERGGLERGFDGAKLIKGRKRHLLVDTLGLVHGLLVHSAGVQDRTGGRLVLEQCRGRMPRLRRIWADGAHRGRLVRWVRRARRWVLQIISRPAGSNGFVLLKWRWSVERTFGWLNLSRRLSKDYEVLPASSEAFIRLAMLSIMLQRRARQW